MAAHSVIVTKLGSSGTAVARDPDITFGDLAGNNVVGHFQRLKHATVEVAESLDRER